MVLPVHVSFRNTSGDQHVSADIDETIEVLASGHCRSQTCVLSPGGPALAEMLALSRLPEQFDRIADAPFKVTHASRSWPR
jgi:hypothetical protein